MDQLNITDTGEIDSQPITWDGEPLYSQSTVQEGLFPREPFEQMHGQTAMDTDAPDNSAEAVNARRDMFRGFGWSVT